MKRASPTHFNMVRGKKPKLLVNYVHHVYEGRKGLIFFKLLTRLTVLSVFPKTKKFLRVTIYCSMLQYGRIPQMSC